LTQIPDGSTVGSCAEREPYALSVLGDSMAPEFPDGCIIIIDPTPYCEHGNYVFAELADDERWFRQFIVRDERRFLVAVNDAYPDIDVTDMPLRIRGVITQCNIKRKVKHY
jgi:DNA polymerase V